MSKTPEDFIEPKNLRFLRLLVTVLTITMICGIITLVFLIVIKMKDLNNNFSISLPKEIILPDDKVVKSFTKGTNWYAIVTESNEILIYDSNTNNIKQIVKIK
jgi:predicted PurR-regulated permease PerM